MVTAVLRTNGKPTKKGKIYVGSYEENPLKIHRPSFNIELKAASLWAAFKISL